MIQQLEKLTLEEQELLMKAPVLLSVLASCSDHVINKTQKKRMPSNWHILKHFTAVPRAKQPYFKREVEKNFTRAI